MKMKRWVGLLLALVMVLGLVPSAVATEGAADTITIDGKVYQQMYVKNGDSYVTLAEGVAGSGGDILFYVKTGNEYVALNATQKSEDIWVYTASNITVTCDDVLGEAGAGADGTNWRKGSTKPGAEGYFYAVKDNEKYAIKATIGAPLVGVYTQTPTSTDYATGYVAKANGRYQISYDSAKNSVAYICTGLTAETSAWTFSNPTSSNSAVSVLLSEDSKTLTVTLGSGQTGTVETTISVSVNGKTNSYDLVFKNSTALTNKEGFPFSMHNELGSRRTFQLYYGDTPTLVPPDATVTLSDSSFGTISASEDIATSGNWVWIAGSTLPTQPSGKLKATINGVVYSADISVGLPNNGFYTDYTVLSEETYLLNGFNYDGTNNTFYLVWNDSHSYIPANSDVSITYGDGATTGLISTTVVETKETFNNTDVKRHAIKFTVANTVSDDFSFEVNFGLINRDGGTETNNWGIRVIDSTPKLMYRYMSWDKGQPYEDTARSLWPASELNITYGNTETVKFYYGTAEKYVAASEVTAPENSCIKVTPGTTTDGKSTAYWELEGTDLGTTVLSVSGGTGTDLFTTSHSWTVDLPLIGIYSGTTASKDAYCSNVEYTGNDIVLYILPNSSGVTITSVTANGGPAGDHTTISNNIVTISSELTGSCNLSYKVFYTIGNDSDDVYIDFAFNGKNQGDEDGNGGNQGGGNDSFYTLISEKRDLTAADKVGFEDLDSMDSGPAAFVYNGKTYYLCTMCPRPEEEGTYRMAYAGGGAQGYYEGASFQSEYCIGIWTANAAKDYYTLIDGEEKTALLAAFESWSVEAYHSPDHHILNGYPSTAYPEIYSWIDGNGWPCSTMFKHYEDGLGSWYYKFTGTMKNGTTVTTYAKNGFHFIYNFYEYSATSVADANAKLQEWRSADYSDQNTYQINLPSGELSGIIRVPVDMVNVDFFGSSSDERTVLNGGIGGDGYAKVHNIDFIGCGWWVTNWPNDDVYGGAPNYGLYTAGGGEYLNCTFKNYFHALHCGPNEKIMGRIIFGGTGTLFENNFIALYLNSAMNGGGDLQMTENTFRYNGCALWMENTGNRFTLNDYHLTRCKFYDNGWDVINLLNRCYFLPGQLFERNNEYGHGKFTGRRDALSAPSPENAPNKAYHAAADVSEKGSGVYTFPVAKDDKFNDYDYSNKDAVIGNHNAADWKIPEKDLNGKTITVIQDEKGEDTVVWSFGE